jgi:heme exporter protein B
LVSGALAVLAKDIRVELRARFALNAILMFGISAVTVVSFSIGQASLPTHQLAALYWIVMFFAATAGLSHVFVREEEAGTALALRLWSDPDAVLAGKLLFNLLLLVLLSLIVTPLYLILTAIPDTLAWTGLIFTIVLGVLGLCGATTIVAAIIARAAARGALFAVLSFPLLIPLLLVLVAATQKCLSGEGLGFGQPELQFLLAYPVVTMTASFLLFRFVWKE